MMTSAPPPPSPPSPPPPFHPSLPFLYLPLPPPPHTRTFRLLLYTLSTYFSLHAYLLCFFILLCPFLSPFSSLFPLFAFLLPSCIVPFVFILILYFPFPSISFSSMYPFPLPHFPSSLLLFPTSYLDFSSPRFFFPF